MAAQYQQELYRTARLFRSLPLDLLLSLNLLTERSLIQKDQVIFRENQDISRIYFIISGCFLAIKHTEAGKELAYFRFSSGDHFGLSAALGSGKSAYTILALSDAILYKVQRRELKTLCQKMPEFFDLMCHEFSREIGALAHKSLVLAYSPLEVRVRLFLSEISRRFCLDKLRRKGLSPTHYEIASSVAANREEVSRVISTLNRQGLIESGRQRIRVLDADRLHENLPSL